MAQRLHEMPTESDDVMYVGPGSAYANPFHAYEHCVGEDWGVEDTGRLHAAMGHGWTEKGAREAAIKAYRNLVEDMFPDKRSARFSLVMTLRGKDLVCDECPAGAPCHADVLLELANVDDPLYDSTGLD